MACDKRLLRHKPYGSVHTGNIQMVMHQQVRGAAGFAV